MLRRATHTALATVTTLAMVLAATRTAQAGVQVERSAGAASCPDTASFASRMRDEGAEPATAASDITVRFEHTTDGYRSSISMAGGKRRSLADDAPSCDGLAEATVLAVKLALDLEPAPAITTARAPAAAAPAPPADAPAPAPATRRAAAVAEVSANGVLAFGLGSPVAPGVRAGAALVFGHERWSVGLTGIVLPAQTRDVGEGTVDVSILGGGIEGCGRARAGHSWMFALCGRLEAMSLQGSAHGFAQTKEDARRLFAGTLLGRARARVAGPVALFAEAGAVLPFVRERFAIDTIGVVYDPPIVAATTGIGVVVDFE